MSFKGYWSGQADEGAVGHVDFSGEHEACRCKPLVAARFVFVAVGLPMFWWWAVPQVPLPLWQAVAVVVGGTLVYVAIAYLVNPQADLENLGPCVGMVDDCSLWSDNANRALLGVQCVLGPGRFIGESLFDVQVLLRDEEVEDESEPPQQSPS